MWTEIGPEEDRLCQEVSVQQTVAQYLELQEEMEPQLLASEAFFREERAQSLAELQRRLHALP